MKTQGCEKSEKCFICWRACPGLEAPGNRRTFSGINLLNQLSVVFLLRKVLHIDKKVLEDVISKDGNPGDWGIKLCRCCHATVREAEFLHKRVISLQIDLEGLKKQIKETVLASQTETDDTKACPKTRKRGRVGAEKECKNVQDCLRETFFKNWKEGYSEPHSVQVLYTVPKSGWTVDNLQTSQPVNVKIVTPIAAVENVTAAFDDEVLPTPNDAGAQKVVVKNEPMEPVDYPMGSPSSQDDVHDWGADDEFQPEDPLQDEVRSFNGKGMEDDDEPEFKPAKKRSKRMVRSKKKPKTRDLQQKACQLVRLSLDKVPEEGIQEDLNIVKKDSEESYKCPRQPCKKTFQKKFDCYVHILKDHYGDPLPYHCHVCDSSRRFQSDQSFRRHMARYHTRAKHPYEDDFNPEEHSAEKLKSVVVEDTLWKTFEEGNLPTEELGSSDEEEVARGVPPEILAQFQPSKTTIHTCRIGKCRRKFNNEMLRDGHEKRIHQGIKTPYSCTQCGRKFYRSIKLLHHLTTAHYSSTFYCNHCGSRFSDKVALAGHIGRAHLGQTHPFKCSHCPQRFLRRLRMEIHCFKKHGVPLPSKPPRKIPIKKVPVPSLKIVAEPAKVPSLKHCWVCHTEGTPLQFDSHEDLKSHNASVHPQDPTNPDHQPFQCPFPSCTKSYNSKRFYKLDWHVTNIHNGVITEEVPLPFQCTDCPMSFHRAYLLDAHMSRVHDKANYICQICAKPFRTLKYLEDHQRQRHYKELNIEPLKCEHCGKVLNTKKSLAHHIKLVHLNESDFKCPVAGCDFGAMYESALKVHLNIRHSDKKNAICPVCSKTFAEQFYLTQHMLRMHSAQKFTCPTCSREFADPSTFKRHCESHEGRFHKCPVEGCGREYNTRHAFRVHLKQHQAKGVPVEIPKIRYQPAELDSEPVKNDTEEGEQEGALPLLENSAIDETVEREQSDLPPQLDSPLE